jgi:CubicO group peptidase (beta-lactamase class C family)
MAKDTIFRIFSMTKPIVSVGIMVLIEEGHFLLNDPIAKFIPEFAAQKVGVE